MLRNKLFAILMGVSLILFISGCVEETTVRYSGLTKAQVMEQARTSMLGLGLKIVYDDEARGIIQAVKESAGGASGYILPIGDKTFGGFSSKPSGVSDFFALTFYENEIILRIDGDTALFTDIIKRMSRTGGRFEWGTARVGYTNTGKYICEKGEIKAECK